MRRKNAHFLKLIFLHCFFSAHSLKHHSELLQKSLNDFSSFLSLCISSLLERCSRSVEMQAAAPSYTRPVLSSVFLHTQDTYTLQPSQSHPISASAVELNDSRISFQFIFFFSVVVAALRCVF